MLRGRIIKHCGFELVDEVDVPLNWNMKEIQQIWVKKKKKRKKEDDFDIRYFECVFFFFKVIVTYILNMFQELIETVEEDPKE